MKPRRVLHMLSIVFVVAVAALLRPQQDAQAKICYDSSKNVIPCPKSSLVLTQEAAKQALAAQTAIPSATATASPLPPTATATPVPATTTATASPSPTATARPAATSTPVAAVVVPSNAGNDDAAACGALPYR